MANSATDCINPAFEHAKQQLFKPFRFGQWTRLALVGFLAGELSSSGGCNFHMPAMPQHRGPHQFLHSPWPPPFWAHHPAFSVGLITFLVVLGLGLFVLFMYVNSVMRFILFDSVVKKECHIREGWSRRSAIGLRFFVWQILLALVSLAFGGLLIGIPLAFAWAAGWFKQPNEHLAQLMLGGIVLFLVFFAGLLVLGVINVMTKDFVVPQMALEGVTAIEGWRRLWPVLKAEKGGYTGYILMKIVLAIGAGIVFGIITVVATILLLLPVVATVIAAVLGGKAAGLTWTFYTISMAVTGGIIVFFGLMYVIAFISVPVTVFFPAYSLYFFAPRYPALAAVMPPPPAPISAYAPTPPMPPFSPPPAPPPAAPLG